MMDVLDKWTAWGHCDVQGGRQWYWDGLGPVYMDLLCHYLHKEMGKTGVGRGLESRGGEKRNKEAREG
ncbi:hypothetical protein ACOMHN_053289 [Nucella lapillus]